MQVLEKVIKRAKKRRFYSSFFSENLKGKSSVGSKFSNLPASGILKSFRFFEGDILQSVFRKSETSTFEEKLSETAT